MARQLERATVSAGQPPQLARGVHTGGAGLGGSADAVAASAETRAPTVEVTTPAPQAAADGIRRSQVHNQTGCSCMQTKLRSRVS